LIEVVPLAIAIVEGHLVPLCRRVEARDSAAIPHALVPLYLQPASDGGLTVLRARFLHGLQLFAPHGDPGVVARAPALKVHFERVASVGDVHHPRRSPLAARIACEKAVAHEEVRPVARKCVHA
jgi:hypothetical protein